MNPLGSRFGNFSLGAGLEECYLSEPGRFSGRMRDRWALEAREGVLQKVGLAMW